MPAFARNTSAAAANLHGTLVPRYLKVSAAATYCGLGRSTLYELLADGRVRSHKVGSARLIDRESLDQFIRSQPAS